MIKKKITLIEILIVISIIIIVLSLLISSSNSYLQKVRAKEASLVIKQIDSAIKNYNSDFSTYFPLIIDYSGATYAGNDIILDSSQRGDLFDILTGNNSRDYNYLANIQLDNDEVKNPWGQSYQIIVNNHTLTSSTTVNSVTYNDSDTINLGLIGAPAQGIIQTYSKNSAGNDIPPRIDYIIYTLTPNVKLSNINDSTSGLTNLPNGCLHSLADDFK